MQTGEKIKKVLSLEEVINRKSQFYYEAKEALEKKLKISLKIWLRIKKLDNLPY